MIYLQRTLRAMIVAVLLAPLFAHAAGDAEAGQVKADTCMGCHGIKDYSNVYPTYRVPKLGGQHPEYIVAALKAYKAGERSHPTMKANAAQMSDQDMADIAAYLSSAPKSK
ncbi:MAG: c-type cytochrome [Nevskiales bacterium]